MKKYKKFKFLIIVAVSFAVVSSCSDSLEENPNFITEDTFYQTALDARLAVNGIYETLGGGLSNRGFSGVYFNNYWTATALASDEGKPGPLNTDANYLQLANYSVGSTNTVILDMWSDFYASISAANLAIDNIPGIDMDNDQKKRLLGEAHFLRGLFYFELVRLYGNVPLQLHATTSFTKDSYLARAPVSEVYTQIIADLTIGESNLPNSHEGADKGRPTFWSAKGYLAKVALTLGDWSTAISKTEEIMAGPFSLWADYKEAFLIPNNNGKETVFSINFDKGATLELIWEGAHLNYRPMAQEYRALGGGGGDLEIPTDRVYEIFDDLDRRKSVTFVTEDNIGGEDIVLSSPHIHKYWDRDAEPSGTANTINDLQLIRYSDVLLMHAEALNEVNNGPTAEALNAINAVRARARNTDGVIANVLPDLEMTLNYQEFKDAILMERFKEFVWEGQRWFDLKRFDRFTQKILEAKPDVTVTNDHLLFPIPQRERDINPNLTQNNGY